MNTIINCFIPAIILISLCVCNIILGIKNIHKRNPRNKTLYILGIILYFMLIVFFFYYEAGSTNFIRKKLNPEYIINLLRCKEYILSVSVSVLLLIWNFYLLRTFHGEAII